MTVTDNIRCDSFKEMQCKFNVKRKMLSYQSWSIFSEHSLLKFESLFHYHSISTKKNNHDWKFRNRWRHLINSKCSRKKCSAISQACCLQNKLNAMFWPIVLYLRSLFEIDAHFIFKKRRRIIVLEIIHVNFQCH